MKTAAIFVFSLMMSVITFGQLNPQILSDDLHTTPPEFPGSVHSYQYPDATSIEEYLSNKVQYAQNEVDGSPPGTEVISFVVTSTGDLTEFRVINSVSTAIDEEVIRLLKTTSGCWRPGYTNGGPVDMEQEVSLVLIPYANYDIVKEARNYLEKGIRLLDIQKNPRKALECLNKAIRLRPNNECILAARSRCKYELGDEFGAIQDCRRIMYLNSANGQELTATDPYVLLKQLMGQHDLAVAKK